jgi:hypothetical protein
VLVYNAITGNIYSTVKTGWATYAALKSAFATYSGVLTNSPGH